MSFQEYASSLEEKARFGRVKPQHLIGLGVLVLFVISFVTYNFVIVGHGAQNDFSVESVSAQEEVIEETESIFLHVSGCVNNPGLIELKEGDRVAKAIELAGGASEDANLDTINLAKKVEDGEQIVVPSRNQQILEQEEQSSSDAASTSSNSANSGKININTADVSELQKISGIGASKAQKIIAYRQSNGRFKSVDELTNVSGIGEKTLASIRDQICV